MMFTNVIRVLSVFTSRSYNSQKKISHGMIPNPTYYIPNYFSLSSCSLLWAPEDSCWVEQDYATGIALPKKADKGTTVGWRVWIPTQ